MTSAIEITSSAVRLVERREGRVVRLQEWPVSSGVAPVEALAATPLPAGLGRVRVVLAHDDLLLRTLTQPEGPAERLDRMVRFEVAALTGDDPATVSWIRLPGEGEARILALITRRRLIDQVQAALAPHGATLDGLTHPALALPRLVNHQAGAEGSTGTEVLIDIGGKQLHIALIRAGGIVLLRTHQPGLDALVEEVAALRSISVADARSLVRNLSQGSPHDMKDLVVRHAGQVGAAITAAARFARTQLNLEGLEPERLHLTGMGALVHGFLPALQDRMQVPVRLINPFAAASLNLGTAELDRLAGLPGPWAMAMGASLPHGLELDALADHRRARQVFWRGPGALAAAAVVAAVLGLAGAGLAESRAQEAAARRALAEEALPQVRDLAARLDRARTTQAAAATRIAWLDVQRRPSRVVPELLGVIGRLQDPSLCPVVLRTATFARAAGATTVELTGHAAPGAKGTAAALHAFEDGLKRSYPVIASVTPQPVAIERDRQPFRYLISIPDTAP